MPASKPWEGTAHAPRHRAAGRAASSARRHGSSKPSSDPLQRLDGISLEISQQDFLRFRDLIYSEAGIWLSEAKVALLTCRLANRLRCHGMKTFEEYYGLVTGSGEERIHMLDAICTNETHFFREPMHWDVLKEVILPQWLRVAAEGRRERRIRVLSMGCSSGQEPYSLAMILLAHFPAGSGWEIEITATDLSTRVLEVAKQGVWPAEKAKEIPPDYLREFMLKGVGEQTGRMKAGPDIRSLIRFARVNLNADSYPISGRFDLIFCRNVLIYFDRRSRQKVVRRLAALLSLDGYFFVGHAESLHEFGDVLTTFVPTVYRPAALAGAERRTE